QTCTATHRFQPYPQGTPTMPGPYAITGLPSLAALTAASQGSRCQAILAMFVTYSPGCGRMILPSLASFASVCAHLAESAGFAFAPGTAVGLFGFAAGGASACCASRRPPVTAAVATRNAALIFNLVVPMDFNTPSVKEDSFKEDTFIENMPVLLCVHDDSAFGLSRSSILHKRGRSVIYGTQ